MLVRALFYLLVCLARLACACSCTGMTACVLVQAAAVNCSSLLQIWHLPTVTCFSHDFLLYCSRLLFVMYFVPSVQYVQCLSVHPNQFNSQGGSCGTEVSPPPIYAAVQGAPRGPAPGAAPGGYGAPSPYGGAPQYPQAQPAYGGYPGYPPAAAAPAYPGYGGGYPQANPYGGYPQASAAPYGGQAPYGGAGAGGYDPYGAQGQQAYGGAGGYGQQGAQPSPQPAAGGGGQWQELSDNEGRSYYYNQVTGVSQWDRPADM